MFCGKILVFTRSSFVCRKIQFFAENLCFLRKYAVFPKTNAGFPTLPTAAMVKAKVAKVKIIEAVDVAN